MDQGPAVDAPMQPDSATDGMIVDMPPSGEQPIPDTMQPDTLSPDTVAPPSCTDQIKNGDETDVDCGGSCPNKCADGQGCLADGDCQGGFCDPADNTCKAPGCADQVKNGNETDVDCGGSCPPCADTKGCLVNADCQSGVCDPTTQTCAAASCSDQVKNGDETDVDCGGSCPKCTDGKTCLADADCQSGFCDPATNTCQAPSCSDQVKNGDETDVDCGGSCPNACADGQGCLAGTDCQSGVCDTTTNTCSAADCHDQVKNGDETDVDCGGSCDKCADTKACLVDADCASGVCDPTSKTCTTPSCTDQIENGDETDVDCGGSCPKCGDGKACAAAADCESGVCDPTSNTCTAASCTDQVKNGDETDVDCGGSCPDKCADGDGCLANADCQSGYCDPTTNTCGQPSCFDNVKNGSETDIDCGGPVCKKCLDYHTCLVAEDCLSGVCGPGAACPTGSVCMCQAATCTDTVKNGNETDVDCGGGTCPGCGVGEACVNNSDCASGLACVASQCTGAPCPVTLFSETFADNSAGWTLGTEWEIGSATISTTGSGCCNGNDPATDHTPTSDNGIAGVDIGGHANTSTHGYYWLTSPVINTEGYAQLTLEFWRWLVTDYHSFMYSTVQIYNGSSWVTLFMNPSSNCVHDTSWTQITYDIAAYANANMRVRFGFQIQSGGVYTCPSWNLDDITISGCPSAT